MFEKLESVEKRFEELTTKISDPAVIADNNEWRKLVKEHSSIEDIVSKYREYKQTRKTMEEAQEMMQDKELKELAEEEYYSSKEKLSKITVIIGRKTNLLLTIPAPQKIMNSMSTIIPVISLYFFIS